MSNVSRLGQSPNSPVCVVSATVLDPTGSKMLVGVRRETGLENRHVGMVSAITRTVPPEILALLINDRPNFPDSDEIVAVDLPHSAEDVIRLGHGEHGTSPHAYVLEATLAKAGLAGLFAAGLIRARATPTLRTTGLVPDSNTELSEYTHMLHYRVDLEPGSDLELIPKSTQSYSQIEWSTPTEYLKLSEPRISVR